MNTLQKFEAKELEKTRAGKKMPAFSPGDTVKVNLKIREGERERIQAYEGVCIARAGTGINENFTVRKISYNEGVERVYSRLYSPRVASPSRWCAAVRCPPRQAILSARPARQVSPYRRTHHRSQPGRRKRRRTSNISIVIPTPKVKQSASRSPIRPRFRNAARKKAIRSRTVHARNRRFRAPLFCSLPPCL